MFECESTVLSSVPSGTHPNGGNYHPRLKPWAMECCLSEAKKKAEDKRQNEEPRNTNADTLRRLPRSPDRHRINYGCGFAALCLCGESFPPCPPISALRHLVSIRKFNTLSRTPAAKRRLAAPIIDLLGADAKLLRKLVAFCLTMELS